MPCGYNDDRYGDYHGDDCRCSCCKKNKARNARQEKLRKEFTSNYLSRFEANLKGVSYVIHLEKGRAPEYSKPNVQQFKAWLDDCDPFPEDMSFRVATVFGEKILFTHHVHRDS